MIFVVGECEKVVWLGYVEELWCVKSLGKKRVCVERLGRGES